MDLYGQPELAYVKCDCFKVTLKMCFMQIKKFILSHGQTQHCPFFQTAADFTNQISFHFITLLQMTYCYLT